MAAAGEMETAEGPHRLSQVGRVLPGRQSGLEDMMVRTWSTTAGEMVSERKGPAYCVESVAFSHNGSRIVSGSSDKTVALCRSPLTSRDIQVHPLVFLHPTLFVP
jgi:WD40 repeat protein